jgi:ferredoxin
MKYVVDEALCAGHGLCYKLVPQVFGADEEGFNENVGRTVDVPPELEEAARRGARSCPEAAIRLFE